MPKGGGQSKKAAAAAATKKKTARKSREGDGAFDISAMSSNIPKHLDEDIDDDIAFNSEDDAMYGEFFANKAPAKGKKAKKGGKSDINDEFDKLNAADDLLPGDFSDDSRDEFDLSEMLDTKEERRGKRKERREGRKAPKDPVTREAESVFSTVTGSKQGGSSATMQELLAATDSSTKQRIDSARGNMSTLLTQDIPEHLKEKQGRELTRATVEKDLKKYRHVLKEQKKATTLSFPLREPDHNAVPSTLGGIVSVAEQAAAEKPTTMQQKMNDLLQRSGLSSKANAQDEENVPDSKKSHLKFREEGEGDEEDNGEGGHSYMAKLKAMVSYEVGRRRRFNKIKSKTYRRILRKEKEREKERRDKAFELLNPEAARQRLQTKMEKLRAEERITQRHKNTSKWVKHAKGYAKFDDDTKQAIDEQHAAHQRLMQKMEAGAGEEAAALMDEESESEEEDRRVDELLSGANAKSVLWGDQGEGEDEDDGLDPKNPLTKARRELNSMGFMKKAKAKQTTQMGEELKDLQEDIARYQRGEEPLHGDDGQPDQGFHNLEDDEDLLAEDEAQLRRDAGKHSLLRKANKRGAEAEEETGLQKAAKVHGTGGTRKAFATKNAVKPAIPGADGPNADGSVFNEEDFEDNDDVDGDSNVEEDQANDEPEQEGLPVKRSRREGKAAKNVHFTTEEGFSSASIIPTKKEAKVGAFKKRLMPKRTRDEAEAENDAAEAEQADEAAARDDMAAPEDGQQDYLIARAFASDDIDEDFLKQKEAQVESIMKPVDKNASLPGWGEWGGEDEKLNRRHQAKVTEMETKRKVEKSTLMSARADANLDHVIINHDVDLVPEKYGLKMVPRPFSNAQEFKRSMRQPMGPEWNTPATFRDSAQPRVVTKQGTVIEPLDLTVHGKKVAKTTRRKSAKQ